MLPNIATLAKIAFREAQLATEAGLPEHDIEVAEFYANMALKDLAASSTYDPLMLAVDKAEEAIIQYVKIRLLGLDPHQSSSYVHAKDQWTKTAARQHYTGHPESYPDHPRVRRRLRANTTRKFTPPPPPPEN